MNTKLKTSEYIWKSKIPENIQLDKRLKQMPEKHENIENEPTLIIFLKPQLIPPDSHIISKTFHYTCQTHTKLSPLSVQFRRIKNKGIAIHINGTIKNFTQTCHISKQIITPQ